MGRGCVMTAATAGESPYKGLMPYEEEDWPYFFGRDTDRAIIASNLKGSRLTLLYGPSGAGKSSVLGAGVAHAIHEITGRNMEEIGRPGYAFVHFRSWRGDPAADLLAEVRRSVERTTGRPLDPLLPRPSLSRALGEWGRRLNVTLLIVLDQFEEYLLYHDREEGEGTFGFEFPRAVGRPESRANFLISIREEALAKLDRFEGRIPGLFDNYLRIDPLDARRAREAIEGPIRRYRELNRSPEGPAEIESELVEEVLAQVRAGEFPLGAAGRGVIGGAEASSVDAVEATYLQLVLTRLWDEERRRGSRTLRRQTLGDLGGAEKIVSQHLDRVLGRLSPHELRVAWDVMPFLVTPSGAKIAQEPSTLASWTRHPVEEVRSTLERLASQEGRILRRVDSPGRPESYEIFHDVLARVILAYVKAQETVRAEGQLRKQQLVIAGLAAGLIAVVLLCVFAFWERDRAQRERDNARREWQSAEKILNRANAAMRGFTDDKAIINIVKYSDIIPLFGKDLKNNLKMKFSDLALRPYQELMETDEKNTTYQLAVAAIRHAYGRFLDNIGEPESARPMLQSSVTLQKYIIDQVKKSDIPGQYIWVFMADLSRYYKSLATACLHQADRAGENAAEAERDKLWPQKRHDVVKIIIALSRYGYRDQAVELMGWAYEKRIIKYSEITQDPDLAPLSECTGFQSLLSGAPAEGR